VSIYVVSVSWGKKVKDMVGARTCNLKAKFLCRTCSLAMAREG